MLHLSTLRERGDSKKPWKKSKWIQRESEIDMEQLTLKAASKIEGNDLLNRCLVRCFLECGEIPTRNDMRKCAQHMWKGAQNLLVHDMNGVQFLFEFQSRKDVEHILLGD